MKFSVLPAVAAVCLVASAPSWAQSGAAVAPGEPGRTWKICDGFGGPSLSGDGMTTYASTLFLFIAAKGGDTFRKSASASRESIAACDQDLADPLIRDRFHLRRASLLRAKAMHQLAAGETKPALETLDLAEQVNANPENGFYRRSFGLGIDYVRAYALERAGDREAARTLARATWRQRPYATQFALAAAILLGRSGDRGDIREALVAEAQLDPRRIDDLFMEAVDARRWSEAVAIYPHLVPDRKFTPPPAYDFQQMATALENRARGEVFWAARGGLNAVALASLGRPQEAEAALQAARARLDTASKTIPPMELNGRRVKAKYLPAYAERLNAQIAKDGPRFLDLAAEEVARIGREGPGPPEVRGPARPLGEPEEELSSLLSSLPEVELAARVPLYGAASKSFFADDSGYAETLDAARGVTKISYRAHGSTTAVIEEMALLRAAQYALAQGKPGFVIVERLDTQHTVVTRTNGIPGPASQDGFSTELEVIAMDPQNLPAGYRGAEWRVIDAKAVVAALAPVYPVKPVKPAKG